MQDRDDHETHEISEKYENRLYGQDGRDGQKILDSRLHGNDW